MVAGRAMLKKLFAGLKNKPANLIMVVFVVSLFALVMITTPMANALNLKLNLNPAEGAVGATVFITGSGFSPNEPVTFVCNNNQMFSPSITSDSNGKINGSCTVPNFAAGTYHVTAYDSSGVDVSVPFVVTGGGTATAAPTATSSSSTSTSGNSNGNGNSNSNGNGNGNSNVFPTFPPTSTSSSGFFSPIVIGIIVAVLVAFAVSGTLLYRRSSRQKMLLERERDRDRDRMPYGSGPSQAPYGSGGPPSGYGYGSQPSNYNPAPSSAAGSSRYTPYSYRQQSSSSSQSRYNQSSSYKPSSYASRYSQPSSQQSSPSSGYRQQPQSGYSRPAMHSKTCSNCKRSVREDQNICPYCNKRT